jgi:hypothetical protein
MALRRLGLTSAIRFLSGGKPTLYGNRVSADSADSADFDPGGYYRHI